MQALVAGGYLQDSGDHVGLIDDSMKANISQFRFEAGSCGLKMDAHLMRCLMYQTCTPMNSCRESNRKLFPVGRDVPPVSIQQQSFIHSAALVSMGSERWG